MFEPPAVTVVNRAIRNAMPMPIALLDRGNPGRVVYNFAKSARIGSSRWFDRARMQSET
jgi:hypothetical protein